jgi:hypothetical protein
MDPLTALMIGSAVGLGKSYLIDQPKEKRQRELAAKTQELSPWTGLRASGIEEADPFGSALQFGTTGAMMGSSAAQDAYKKKYAEALADSLGKQTANPYSVMAAMPADYGMGSKTGIYGGE